MEKSSPWLTYLLWWTSHIFVNFRQCTTLHYLISTFDSVTAMLLKDCISTSSLTTVLLTSVNQCEQTMGDVGGPVRFVGGQWRPTSLIAESCLTPVHLQSQIFPRFFCVLAAKLLLACRCRRVVFAPCPLAHSLLQIDDVSWHDLIDSRTRYQRQMWCCSAHCVT